MRYLKVAKCTLNINRMDNTQIDTCFKAYPNFKALSWCVIPVVTAPGRELDDPRYLTPVKSQQPPEGSCTSPVAGQPE